MEINVMQIDTMAKVAEWLAAPPRAWHSCGFGSLITWHAAVRKSIKARSCNSLSGCLKTKSKTTNQTIKFIFK